MTLTAEQTDEVREILGRYCAAYQRKDLKALLALFSPDIRGYGAGPDEVFRNRKEYTLLVKRDLVQATSIVIEFRNLDIAGEGRIAWVTTGCNCLFTSPGNAKQTMKVRMTFVLKNTGSRWLIEQIHISAPNAGQIPGQSFSDE